ncbi:hypothetical protein PSAC2689_20499 [Paraburkholderia sacchari]
MRRPHYDSMPRRALSRPYPFGPGHLSSAPPRAWMAAKIAGP